MNKTKKEQNSDFLAGVEVGRREGKAQALIDEIEWLKGLNSNDIRDITKDLRLAKLQSPQGAKDNQLIEEVIPTIKPEDTISKTEVGAEEFKRGWACCIANVMKIIDKLKYRYNGFMQIDVEELKAKLQDKIK